MPASSISGWSALVTGGSMGLGLESARALVRDGCTVTIAARRAEQLAEAVEGLKADAAEGTGVFSVQCDVLVEESVNNAVKAAYKNGGSKLNIVVHSAGGFQPDAHLISLVNVPLEGWKANLDFNLTSFFLVVKHAAPFLAKTAKGMPTEMSERPPTASVVAISSVYAVRHAAFGSPYCVSKAGVDATVRAFACELGSQGIRVNAIDSGLILTPLTKVYEGSPLFTSFFGNQILERHGSVADIGNMVRFLAGPESAWITAESISVDGGHRVFGAGSDPDKTEATIRMMFGAAADERIQFPEAEE